MVSLTTVDPVLLKLVPSPLKLVAVITPLAEILGILNVFEEALNVKSASVEDEVIVPVVRVVNTTLCVPEAALKVDPVLLKLVPSPLKLVAVTTPLKLA